MGREGGWVSERAATTREGEGEGERRERQEVRIGGSWLAGESDGGGGWGRGRREGGREREGVGKKASEGDRESEIVHRCLWCRVAPGAARRRGAWAGFWNVLGGLSWLLHQLGGIPLW